MDCHSHIMTYRGLYVRLYTFCQHQLHYLHQVSRILYIYCVFNILGEKWIRSKSCDCFFFTLRKTCKFHFIWWWVDFNFETLFPFPRQNKHHTFHEWGDIKGSSVHTYLMRGSFGDWRSTYWLIQAPSLDSHKLLISSLLICLSLFLIAIFDVILDMFTRNNSALFIIARRELSESLPISDDSWAIVFTLP